MRALLASLIVFAAVGSTAAQQRPVEYRFDLVKRMVTLTSASKQLLHVSTGSLAHGGDHVTTGLFSYALIGSEHYHARFEIFGSTEVTLSQGVPGLILSLDRGRLRAAFDKIIGNEPRVVKTPGALLAVRGTRYDVTVDKSGQTTLDVVEGVVEVRSPLVPQPVLIHAGERSVFSQREPPTRHNSPPGAGRNDGADGRQQNDPRGRDGRGAGPVDGRDNPGDHRGSPSPPPSNPQPPHGGPGPHL
jgi:hypothetical protein